MRSNGRFSLLSSTSADIYPNYLWFCRLAFGTHSIGTPIPRNGRICRRSIVIVFGAPSHVMKTTANFSWKRYNALQGACSPEQRSMIWTPISASTTSQSLSWKRKCGSPPTMAETIKEPSALHTRDPFFRNIGLLKSGTFANFHFGYNLSVSFSAGLGDVGPGAGLEGD